MKIIKSEKIRTAISEGIKRRRGDTLSLAYDVGIFVISFLFSRFHIVFGLYPLGGALLSVIPGGVFIALIGSVAGSLSLGRSGIIYGITAVITVFLRVLISNTDKEKVEASDLFKEPLIIRIAVSMVSAFVGGMYVSLTESFSLRSVLFGLIGILFSATFTFLLSGVFDSAVSLPSLVLDRQNVLTPNEKRSLTDLAVFQGSALVFVFLISMSLKEYQLFGINPAYIFSAAITLITAKRLGPVRAAAVGFISSFGISGIYSVAFTLMGIAVALLYRIGGIYATTGGALTVGIWGFYSGGVMGFLELFPEYAAAVVLSAPFLKRIEPIDPDSVSEKNRSDASDMVTATALSYKSRVLCREELESSLEKLSGVLRRADREDAEIKKDECRDLIISSVSDFCSQCPHFEECNKISPTPCMENIEKITLSLIKENANETAKALPGYCKSRELLGYRLKEDIDRVVKARRSARPMEGAATEWELIATMIGEVREDAERRSRTNTALTEKAEEAFSGFGFSDGSIRVLGNGELRVIGAGKDGDGSTISSDELIRSISEAIGKPLGRPELYRRDEMALFECQTLPPLQAYAVCGSKNGRTGEVSGDTFLSFNGAGGSFCAVLSDGMGSGRQAERTSLLSAEYLEAMLTSPCKRSTALHLLNRILRSSEDECSASIDLFELDPYLGEGTFYKCGAAPSYVKRGSSIFRIRSETAPLGIMRSVDAEKIKVEIKPGDTVIMISDGICQTPEDAPWLLSIISEHKGEPETLLSKILSSAQNIDGNDDMTVAVITINDSEAKTKAS